MAHRLARLIRIASILCAAAALLSCGGQVSDSFTGSVYIVITTAGGVRPAQLPAPNGDRIVFINDDTVRHTVTWDSPLTLTATIEPNGRAWFDLPNLFAGTVVSYHLDSGGTSGSVTIVAPQ